MLTLTSKTRFWVIRGYQKQSREGDLGGSPGHGWTGRPKTDNILLVRWGVTIFDITTRVFHLIVLNDFVYQNQIFIQLNNNKNKYIKN